MTLRRLAILVFAVSLILGLAWLGLREMRDERTASLADQCISGKHAMEACNAMLAQQGLSPRMRGIALAARGIVYSERKEYQRAFSDFNASIKLNPDDPVGYYGRGSTYRFTDHCLLAIADFDRAMDRIGHNDKLAAYTLAGRASCFLKAGETARAIADAERALKTLPRDEMVLRVHAAAASKQGRYALALKDTDALIALDPGEARNYNNRCFYGAIVKSDAATLSACDRALALLPGRADFLDSRCFARFKAGQHAAAIADCDKALSARPDFASSLYVRGLAKQSLGDGSGSGDIARAVSLDAKIADTYAAYGAVP